MKLSKKQKREAVKIAIGGGLFLAGWAVSALSGCPVSMALRCTRRRI